LKKARSPQKPVSQRYRHNAANEKNPTTPPPEAAPAPTTDGAQFAEPVVTPDPTRFSVQHGSDKAAYTYLDAHKGSLKPRTFPIAKDKEPRMSLADAIGSKGAAVEGAIKKAEQIVFHTLGDTGNTTSAIAENSVTDKLVSDFNETDPRAVPSFCYNLGDVVYSFGEAQYYYDQFYDPYRDYPATIFAIPGNHDGMVSPIRPMPSLQAFISNFCAYGAPFHRTPEAGGLSRTAGIQPAVYFTLEASFVRILGLYSNCLEDPGVISSQKGAVQTYSYLPDSQLDFLDAALSRVKSEKFAGAVIIAVHHPPYVAVTPAHQLAGKHRGSPLMLSDIDKVCQSTGVWPHAVLSGHAHDYQRFTRYLSGREIPFLVVGNGAHGHTAMTKKGDPALRTPNEETSLSNGNDRIIFENYDDKEFGYCRVVVDEKQLRIEYHPASDGARMKTPDDSVTVDLARRKLIHYQVPS
jgi:hypothetical protein